MSRREETMMYFDRMSDALRERIETGIEQNRKGTFRVIVKDRAGKPLPSVQIHAVQKKHRFQYGANLFMLDELETEAKNQAYRTAFAEVFNQATLPFYWSDLESEEGHPRFAADSPRVYRRPAPDLCLGYCREQGITPKAHCLTYFNVTPAWVDANDVSDMKAKLETRYSACAEHYRDTIPSWEVLNELLCTDAAAPNRWAFFKDDEVVEWNFALAEKYFPHNELVINEAPYVWLAPGYAYNRSPYYQLIDRSLRNGARIDAIAMQFHVFNKAWEKSMYDPQRLFDVLDLYARFGRPLQISEITIPAYSGSAEDEELQADLLENLYAIWFSHKSVEMITYWNLVDGYAAWAPQGDMTKGENIFYGGLMRFDLSHKPAYERLRFLFGEKWHTEATVTTDRDGLAIFRGFYGDYELIVDAAPHKARFGSDGEDAVTITPV